MRAANAISTIAWLVSNGIRVQEAENDEPVPLSADTQAGLIDAPELIAHGMQFEADFVDEQNRVVNDRPREKE